MSSIARFLREKLATDVFTDSEVANLVDGSPNRRYGLMKRALADGDIIQLRRGVYGLGKQLQRAPLSPFELAQKIYPPCYLSLESALSHHGWIPEVVFTFTSVSLKRSKVFETPIGNFSYTRIPEFNFIGVERVCEARSIYLIATPTKALADYILTHKIELSPKQLRDFLRIEKESWRQISCPLLNEIAASYGNLRLGNFIKTLRRDAGL